MCAFYSRAIIALLCAVLGGDRLADWEGSDLSAFKPDSLLERVRLLVRVRVTASLTDRNKIVKIDEEME